MDADWRFAFGNPSDPSRDFEHGVGYFSYFAKAGYADGPAGPGFVDGAWRRLDLPHDWAVEAPFAPLHVRPPSAERASVPLPRVCSVDPA